MDLRTQYLGLTLHTPLIASSSPLTGTVGGIKRLAAAGVGAVVLPSLFEEQLRMEFERDSRLIEAYTDSHGEALSYLPDSGAETWPSQYLGLVSRAADAVDIPVIASLN